MLKRILPVSIVGTMFALAGCATAPESVDADSDIETPTLQPKGDFETRNGYGPADLQNDLITLKWLSTVPLNQAGLEATPYRRQKLSDPATVRTIAEVVRCALPSTTSFYAYDTGWQLHEFKGEMGFAPEWGGPYASSWVLPYGQQASDPAQITRFERVSACVLALLNGVGRHVPILMNADFIPEAPTSTARSLYTVNEISVYGNVFKGAAEDPTLYYVCAEDPMVLSCGLENMSTWLHDRVCGNVVGGCNVTVTGLCSDVGVCAGSVPGHRVCQAPDSTTYTNVITVRLPRTSFNALNPTCDASGLDDYMDPQCDDGSVEDTTNDPYYFYGCAGKERFADRTSLCGVGYEPVTAADWHLAMQANRDDNANNGTPLIEPSHHYWTDTALNYDVPNGWGNVGPGQCSVSLPGSPTSGSTAYSCGDDPMRVCAPPSISTEYGVTDPLGNVCNWSGCGLSTQGTDDYFGGCYGNLTAGALCKAKECAGDWECGGIDSGLVCLYGTCRKGCNEMDQYCPEDSLCIPSAHEASGSACEIVVCEEDSDCPGAGRVCNTDKGVCQPGCHVNADCGEGSACYGSNGGQTIGQCDDAPEQAGCEFGAPADSFSSTMVGCNGSVAFAQRADLCAEGFHVCSAAEWSSGRDNQAPTHNYWTDNDLYYVWNSGDDHSDSCAVSTSSVGAGHYSCGSEPMRVCTASGTDAEGNSCNWVGCGLEQKAQDYFGGCGYTGAGSLCCQD